MQLRLTPHCICIYLSKTSSHYEAVVHTLNQTFGQPFWIKETLINIALHHELERRKAFLISLYRHCALASKTHNALFLQKLIAFCAKPIKLIITHETTTDTSLEHIETRTDPYRLLRVNKYESFHSIRRKYLRLAKAYHPDTLQTNDDALRQTTTLKFRQIQEAYEVIKAEKKRQTAA